MHAGQAAEFLHLIDSTGPASRFINLLERYQVRIEVPNHPGNPHEIDFAVHTFSVPHVVGQHPYRRGG
jgi:hypothetical protein